MTLKSDVQEKCINAVMIKIVKSDRYSPIICVLHVLNFMFFNSMFQIGHTKIEVLVNIITVYRIPLGV